MDTKQQLVNALAGLGSTITEAMDVIEGFVPCADIPPSRYPTHSSRWTLTMMRLSPSSLRPSRALSTT